MKRYLTLMFIALICSTVILSGCKKNKAPDVPSTPDGPTSGIINIEYTFTSSAEDPEEDSVTIRFDWVDGDTSEWSSWKASGDSVITSHSWSDTGTYNIKAQAKDKKDAFSEWSDWHQIVISSVGEWHCATDSAQWLARWDHAVVVFDNKMWLLGGFNGTHGFNDIWYSSDGSNWTQVFPTAHWSGRWNHGVLVFDNKIWVIGGSSPLNDVWYSSDGINWIEATPAAPWSARELKVVVFNNKMWVVGGFDSSGKRNDVWFSSDGVNWTCACSSAPWLGRYEHTLLVFENRLWLIGGIGNNHKLFNDVWYSYDGSNWVDAIDSAPWSPRSCHSSVVFDNKMWVIGGDSGSRNNDVWFSSDGINWTMDTNTQWSKRSDQESVLFNNHIWILGGVEDNLQAKQDVWYWP